MDKKPQSTPKSPSYPSQKTNPSKPASNPQTKNPPSKKPGSNW